MERFPVSAAVFAKAPVPGFAKTRLIPRLGSEGAAWLQARLTRRAVEIACKSAIGPVSLWCMPSTRHRLFHELAAEYPVTLHAQAGGDLGTRMCDVLCRLTENSPALLIGSDSVVLESSHLIRAADL